MRKRRRRNRRKHPRRSGSGYQFELPVRVVHSGATKPVNRVDLYREGCFLLEAKHEEPGRSNELLLRRAFGQARGYISHLPGQIPPYLMGFDAGHTLIVWDRWSGTYSGFIAGRRIDLRTRTDRPMDIELLRDICQDHAARDPGRRAEAVTARPTPPDEVAAAFRGARGTWASGTWTRRPYSANLRPARTDATDAWGGRGDVARMATRER